MMGQTARRFMRGHHPAAEPSAEPGWLASAEMLFEIFQGGFCLLVQRCWFLDSHTGRDCVTRIDLPASAPGPGRP
jgi:hypothetical protein